MRYATNLIPFLALVPLAACGALFDGGDDDDDGGSGSSGCDELIDNAWASCDPYESAWDDLFIFEADTDSSTDSVEVDVYVGSSFSGTVRLDERGTGSWYGEEWADDLDADCDDWNSMYFEVFAEGDGCDDSATIRP